MADKKRAYYTLVTAMGRKARELTEYLEKTDSQERIARSKHDKLLSDISELVKLGEEYVSTLSEDDDKAVIEKMYDKQSELIETVNQALEGAQEFIEGEEFKMEILKRSQQVEQQCKTVESRLAHFKTKTDRFKTDKYVLPQDSYDVLISELESLVGVIDGSVENIGYLVLNDPDKKVQHEESQDKVDKFKDTLLDLRLTLIGALEKSPSATERKDSLTSFLPKLAPQAPPIFSGQTATTGSGMVSSTGYMSTAGLSSVPPPYFQYQAPQFPSQAVPWTGSVASNLTSAGAGGFTPGVSAAQTPTGNFYPAPSPGGGISKVQIQKIKPPVFDGEICNYPAWKKRWKELISPGSNSECEELYRMQDAMGPKLLSATIKSFQSLTEAWNYLEDQFGRADVAAVKLLRDFKNLNLGKVSDHEKFMEMYRQFRVLATHLNEIGQLAALNSLTEVNLVVSKLPVEIKSKYAEFKSSHRHLSGYSLLSTFMEHQSQISRECCAAIQSDDTGAGDVKGAMKCFACNESGHYSKDCTKKKFGSDRPTPKGMLKFHGLSAKPLPCSLCSRPHQVEDGKNKGKFKTRLAACEKFREMSINERAQALADAGGCVKCTDWQHASKDCDAVYGKKKWQPCTVKDDGSSTKCGKNHHSLLHGASHAYICKLKSGGLVQQSDQGVEEVGDPLVGHCGQTLPDIEGCEVLLLIQNVPILASPSKTVIGLVFFDGGSTIGLIRELFAKKLRLVGKKMRKLVQVVGQAWSVWETVQFAVTLVDQYGEKHLVKAYSIESITSPMDRVILDGIIHKFPDTRPLHVERPEGQVDLLVGLDKSSLHPKAILSVGDLTLYESIFGTGWVLGGGDPALKTSAVVFNSKANKLRHAVLAEELEMGRANLVNFLKTQEKSLSTFMEAEEMGTVQPRRCNSCLGCGSCSNQAMEHSRKEQAELRLIQKSVKINKELKRVEVSYPAIKDFSLLSDNREQALGRAKSLEKRLIKTGRKPSYDEQLQDFITRGAVEKISDDEMKNYNGPVNYVDHHGVLSDSNTTPYRLVVNSSLDNNNSGVSLNDCLPKGPKSIRSLFQCITTFRSYPHVVVFDLSKAYQSMYTGVKEKHLRRIVWRFNPEDPWETYGFLRVTYGDRIAACALEVAKELIFLYGKEVHPVTAVKMGESDYVDDCNVGADTSEELDVFIGDVIKSGNKFSYNGTVSQILDLVGWSAKVMVRNGETDRDAIAKIKEKYLGLCWDPSRDVIKYKLNVNLVPKVRGVRPVNAPEITMENLELLHNTNLTMKVVTSVVYSWYDPPGLVCPLTLKYKLLLSETIQFGLKWKDVLPDIFQTRWKEALEEAVRMDEITFPRSFKPEGVTGAPELVGYPDGSKPAFGCALYIRWRLAKSDADRGVLDKDGAWHPITHVARLVTAKAKISKTGKVPRNEMNGLLLLARLVTATLPGLVDKPTSLLVILDSRCTIQSVEAEAKTLKDFFNNRCEEWGEHRRQWESLGLEVEPLQHTASADNIGDIATKGKVSKEHVDEKSVWQNGPSYLQYERDDSWPINRDMLTGQDAIPDDEKLVRVFSVQAKPVYSKAGDVSWVSRLHSLTKFGAEFSDLKFDSVRWLAERHRCLLKVLRILARLITASSTCVRNQITEEPTSVRMLQARYMLEMVYGQDTAKVVLAGKLQGLDPQLSKGRFVTRGRFGGGIANVLGLVELPILLPESHLSYLIMVQAHEESHSEAKTTLARSRSQAWIVRGFGLAVRVCKECFSCILDRKRKTDQKMGYLPLERFEVGFPPFTNISLDLAAPVKVLDMVKKRCTMKAWPLIICCLNTGAVHLELLHTYGAEAFLLRWKVFTCTRGDPKLVVSDKGSQLQAASKQIDWTRKEGPEQWEWDKIEQATSAMGTKWHFVPAGCQWQNGLAESRIKIFKQTLRRCVVGTINGNKSLVSYCEMQALLADMMDRMNNRPIGLKTLTEQDLVPLTPNCLLLGRTSTRVAALDDADYSVEDYPRRLRYCQELLQFWRREFEKQVFYNLLPYQRYKDTKRFRNLQVGDVCLLSYPGKIQEKSRYCRVDAVHPDEDDVVRNVTISLRSRCAREKLLLYKSRQPMKMVVGVQRLVLVCPSEEVQQQLVGSGADESVGKYFENPEAVTAGDAIVESSEVDNTDEDLVIEGGEDRVVHMLVVSVVIHAKEQILDVKSCGKPKAVGGEHLAGQSVEMLRYSK